MIAEESPLFLVIGLKQKQPEYIATISSEMLIS